MASDAQKRADRKYKRDKTWQFCLRFYPAEAEVWAFLSEHENRQGFIKELIRREMNGSAIVGATEERDYGTAG